MGIPPQIVAAFDALINIVTGLAGVVLAFLLSMAGFHYMTSGGSPQKVQMAKDYATSAIIGFAVIVLARAIAGVVKNALGV